MFLCILKSLQASFLQELKKSDPALPYPIYKTRDTGLLLKISFLYMVTLVLGIIFEEFSTQKEKRLNFFLVKLE